MLGQRSIDPQQGNHYRSDRICAVNGQYFFSTREGTLEGPYFTRVDAEHQINRYIQRMIQSHELYESRAF